MTEDPLTEHRRNALITLQYYVAVCLRRIIVHWISLSLVFNGCV